MFCAGFVATVSITNCHTKQNKTCQTRSGKLGYIRGRVSALHISPFVFCKMYKCVVCLLLAVLSHVTPSFSYMITVDAHAEECFFDKVEAGTKMGNLFIFVSFTQTVNIKETVVIYNRTFHGVFGCVHIVRWSF